MIKFNNRVFLINIKRKFLVEDFFYKDCVVLGLIVLILISLILDG